MKSRQQLHRLLAGLLAVTALMQVSGCANETAEAAVTPQPVPQAAPDPLPPSAKPQPDRTGLSRQGEASFYADSFFGRQMANGERMDPEGDNAASRTLPLGTTAKVTNLETGKSAIVTIQDRGPYAKGRLVDLSPATARKIGISRRQGVARVQVSPIAVPMPDGRMVRGAAARDPEVAQLR
jgi:rare lipoprotein A